MNAGPLQDQCSVGWKRTPVLRASVATSKFPSQGKSTQEQGSPFGVSEYINPVKDIGGVVRSKPKLAQSKHCNSGTINMQQRTSEKSFRWVQAASEDCSMQSRCVMLFNPVFIISCSRMVWRILQRLQHLLRSVWIPHIIRCSYDRR